MLAAVLASLASLARACFACFACSVCLASVVAGIACSGRSSTPVVVEKRDAAVADAVAVVEIAGKPLGMSDVASFQWRKRGGHPAFREARKAEAAGDWPTVVTTCKQALAADPGHLEAAWLLAVGYAKTNKLDDILAPLQLAAAGDFGKWGHASLELPSLQAWLATPTGQAWRRRVDEDRALYLAAIGRSVVIDAGGDLFGFDAEGGRYYRLTRTFGALFAAMRVPDADRILYLTRQRVKGKTTPHLALGMVDLARGRTSRPISIDSPAPAIVMYVQKPPKGTNLDGALAQPGAWIATGMPRATTWRRMDDDGTLLALPPKTKQPPGRYLSIFARSSRLHAVPIPDVAADWDQAGLASAIRIGKSARVISVPSPGLIDGNTLSWSPGKTHLAFVAQLEDRCPEPARGGGDAAKGAPSADGAAPTAKPDDPGARDAGATTPAVPNTAVFVADAATGSLQELERAVDGLVVEWVADRKLAIAGDHGVSIVDLDGAAPVKLEGADGLVASRKKPKCTTDPVQELPIEEDPDATE